MEYDDRIKELEKQVEQQQKVIEALIAALRAKQVVFIPQPAPEPIPFNPYPYPTPYTNPIITCGTGNICAGDYDLGDVQVFI